MKEQLQTLRKTKGLTQEEIANILDVKLSTYQKYERDAISPPYETLIKIADFYNVTTDYLLGRETSDKQPAPIELLSRQSNMDEIEEIFLQKYLAMPKEGRDAIIEMMRSVIDVFRNSAEQGITVYRAARSSDGNYEPPGEVKMTQEEIDEIANAEDADDL